MSQSTGASMKLKLLLLFQWVKFLLPYCVTINGLASSNPSRTKKKRRPF